MNGGSADRFGARSSLPVGPETLTYYRLDALSKESGVDLSRLPYTVKVLLENVVRNHDGKNFTDDHVMGLARWGSGADHPGDFPFMPARVLLQDYTGVPCVADLTAMRAAVARLNGDPKLINPIAPVDLVIDHSVQVDHYGTLDALDLNIDLEYDRNGERYQFLRWAQQGFQNFRVASPGMGIIHQVNLEYLARVVTTRVESPGITLALPDTLVGTDSHTTMVNGLAVLGWGVGGIEAEAAMLGQPSLLQWPVVVGVRLSGQMKEGTTATDLVLTVTQKLRAYGVVNKFVEFFGPGVSQLTLADRATVTNMAPEYGATASMFPVDDETIRYLLGTGRSKEHVALVDAYAKAQGFYRNESSSDPVFSEVVELDLGTIEPSMAGPRRPQDRVTISNLKEVIHTSFPEEFRVRAPGVKDDVQRFDFEGGTVNEAQTPSQASVPVTTQPKLVEVEIGGVKTGITHGSVVIAAITSCTNTSNPAVMIGAGLIAKKAVERGINVRPYVKTSLAPGSLVVTEYLEQSGLLGYLEALRFHVVGYGCTTCIGNSGPLPEPVASAVQENALVVSAVLSGNRNFEGRIHPQARASFLASPMLVVAYALAGRTDIDLNTEPLSYDTTGAPVYLRELWPTSQEIRDTIARTVKPEMYTGVYEKVFVGDERWRGLPVPSGDLYDWDAASTYVQEPPFFEDLSPEVPPVGDITGARVLVMLGDSITTDHISPAGSIPKTSPAGQYLIEHGVQPSDFNSYGARRGNHEVMSRGTFGNIRLRNQLVPGKEGDWTVHLPAGEEMRIYHASERYLREGVPLLVLTGKEYGSGSSRDWAAKGPMMLGVRAVLAESYERIHRSNLVGMGVLPLQYLQGDSAASLGLTGRERFDILGIGDGLQPSEELTVRATGEDGGVKEFKVLARIDLPVEVEYYRHGGLLNYVLRHLLQPE